MGRRARLCATVVVVASSLLWLLLVVGIVSGSAQAYRGSAVPVRVATTVSPQVMPTQGQSAQQGKSTQNEQVPSWVALSLLLIGSAVLLAVLGFMLWIGGLLPWYRHSQPAGWRYEVLLALLAALTAVAALAPEVFAVIAPPIWVRIVFLALAFVLILAAAVVKLHSAKKEQERIWAQQVRGLLNEPLGKDGQVPLLSALSPYRLGVSPSRYGFEEQRGNDPYISRAIDNKLDQALRSKRFILVVGDSKAGKSRTAYEAAIRLRLAERLHDPRVLIPKSTDLLEQILDLDPSLNLQPEPALLWLDNLTESKLEALTPALLDRLLGPLLVLGTLTAQTHSRVMESESDLSRNARLALRRATVIRLEAGLTTEERVEAEQKYSQERFPAGIGEQLVAVDRLTDKYDNAHEGDQPHGWAVVQAAIDWTRMDVGRPIRQHELVALCPLYLHELRPQAEHDDKGHEEALLWACQPVVSHIALLQKLPSDRDEPSYAPFDYLVAVADGQGERLAQAILDPAWDTVLALVPPSEAFKTGANAYLRQLKPRAQKIFAYLVAEYPEEVPVAAVYLGLLLKEQGDFEGAKAAYQQVIASGHVEWAPRAMVDLGLLLRKQGDLVGAKAAFQQAIASGHVEWAPWAMVNLGLLLKEQGKLAGAKAAYQQAIASGHADYAPLAALNLGALLLGQGDFEGAKAAYQQAIASGHAEVAPMAESSLGLLHIVQGTKAALQAIASGHAEVAPMAEISRGLLLELQGDLEGAKAAYQQAIASGHADQAPLAALNLGQLLELQGDLEGAKEAFRRASNSGHAEWAPKAAVFLGLLLKEQGDFEGAKAAYQRASNSGHTEVAPWAAFELGLLLKEQGDFEGAKEAFRRASNSGHTEEAPKAAFELGLLLQKQGDFEGAKEAFRRASNSGHTEVAPKAAVFLGVVLKEQGDFEGAKEAFQRASNSGYTEVAPWAAFELEGLLKRIPPPATS